MAHPPRRRRRRPATLLASALLATAAANGSAAAAEPETDPGLAAAGWRHESYSDNPHNRFTLADDGGIVVETDASVSSLRRPLYGVDLDATPVLAWRWRVDDPVPPTDLTDRGADDRALALFVTFPYVPEQASLFERIARPFVENRLGDDAPGRALIYVWGGDAERGKVLAHPRMRSAGPMHILRPASAPTNRWFEERVDVREDYRRAFGAEPPPPLAFILTADSDSTGDDSRAQIRDLAFVAP